MIRIHGRTASLTSSIVVLLFSKSEAQDVGHPSNATSCVQCHSVPSKLGSSRLTVERAGRWENGKYVPSVEGGIVHRNGATDKNNSQPSVVGERVSVNLLGDGFVEAISDTDLKRNAVQQRAGETGIAGMFVDAPVLESRAHNPDVQFGRFGWKSQHSSLMSACADSLRNELGIRNQLYPDEYPNHPAGRRTSASGSLAATNRRGLPVISNVR